MPCAKAGEVPKWEMELSSESKDSQSCFQVKEMTVISTKHSNAKSAGRESSLQALKSLHGSVIRLWRTCRRLVSAQNQYNAQRCGVRRTDVEKWLMHRRQIISGLSAFRLDKCG